MVRRRGLEARQRAVAADKVDMTTASTPEAVKVRGQDEPTQPSDWKVAAEPVIIPLTSLSASYSGYENLSTYGPACLFEQRFSTRLSV